MKLKQFIFALVAMLSCFGFTANAQVAKVGDAEYATIDEAIAKWTNGTTLTLLADVKLTAQVEIPAGKELTLDLNGKTVNSVFNGNSTTNHIYALSNKGTLTITDTEGNGSINSRGIYNYGSLTLNAGAINAIDGNGGYAVNNQSGSTFVMNGGVVAATNEDDHQSSSGGYDATALKVPAGCTATLNGGTINNVCDFTYAIEAKGTLNIPEKSTITVNGTHGAIAVSGGVTTIDAGTYTIPKDNYIRTDNVLYVSGGSLVVNGGTFIGDSDTASGGSCLSEAAGKAVVNGGTFKGSSGGDVWGTTGTTIKGGKFENLIEKQHIAEGYELNADGTVVKMAALLGSGTEADPYQINSVEDLIFFRNKVDEQSQDGSTQYAGKYIKLNADIDLADINWNPIGSMSGDHGSFKGVFDGGGHTISNLNVDQSGNGLGLFAYTTGNAVIKNLNLVNVTVKSTDNSNYVGGVVGNAYADTKIENVHVSGDVHISGRGYIGGIAGHGYVKMDKVSVVANEVGLITSTFWCAGGVLGYAGEGSTDIKNAHVEGLTITSAAGGLGAIVGMAEDNNGTQPISGSDLSAKNVEIKTYTGAYGDSYSNYALGYLCGGNSTSKLTGNLSVEDVTITTSNGVTPEVNDAVASIDGTIYFNLQSAIEVVAEGKKITVLRDVIFTTGANGSTNGISYTRGVSFTLDLNGKTITSNLGNNALRFKIGDGNSVANTEVTIEIKNGKIVSGSNNWCAISAATADNSGNKLILNLTDLTIEANKAGDFAVKSWAGAVVNTNNVDVTSNYAGGFYAAGGEIVLDENSSVAQKGLHTAPYMSYAFGVSGGGKMTVNGGTYSAVPAAASDSYNQGVSHGSSVGGVMSSGGTLIINGGTFSNDNFGDAAPTAPRSLIMADAGAVVTINGGTFNAMAKIVDPTNNTGDASKNAQVTIADGTFSANPTDAPYNLVKLADGYVAVENNGVWTVEKAAAKVNDTYYATLAEAIAASTPNGFGATVTLLKDITLEGGYADASEGLRIEKSVTIDGAGHTIDCGIFTKGIRIYQNGDKASNVMFKNINIVNNNYQGRCIDTRSAKINLQLNGGVNLTAHGTNSQPLTIGGSEAMTKVTISGGTIDAGTSGYAVICFVPVTNHINVQGNAVIKGFAAFYLKEGVTNTEIKLSQSTSIGTNKKAAASGDFGAIVIEGSNNAVRLEHSGAVVKAVAADGAEMAAQAAFLLRGNNNTVGYYNNADAQVVTEGGQAYWTLSDADVTGTKYERNGVEMLLEAETRGYQFITVEDALRYAKNGDTVKLLANAELDETYVNEKSLTLDLNGKTLSTAYVAGSTTNHLYAIQNNAELTITDSSDAKDGKISARGIFNYGAMTLENGTINAIDGNGGYGVRNYAGATFTMNGGTIATTLEDDNKVDKGGYDATTVRVDEDATFTMNGGELNNICDYTFAIDNYGTTTVKGGKATSVHTTVANYGTINIEGGEFVCNGLEGVTAHAVWAAEGKTNISGGTFNGKDNYNGFNVCASKGANVVITGGEFSPVHSGSLYGDGTITVSGGRFFDKISDQRCELGFQAVVNTKGTYDVKLTNKREAYTIVDGKISKYDNSAEIKLGTFTYKRNLLGLDEDGKYKWSPLYLPVQIPVDSLLENYDVAYINDIHSFDNNEDGEIDKMTIEYIKIKTGTLKANYPYVIRPKNEKARTWNLVLTDVVLYPNDENTIKCSSVFETFTIGGTYHTMTGEELAGKLSIKGNGNWENNEASYTLNPLRLHMSIERDGTPVIVDDTKMSIRIAVRGEDDLTDIDAVRNNNETNTLIFDLQGRRVLKPVKGGIYIINGKKVYFE